MGWDLLTQLFFSFFLTFPCTFFYLFCPPFFYIYIFFFCPLCSFLLPVSIYISFFQLFCFFFCFSCCIYLLVVVVVSGFCFVANVRCSISIVRPRPLLPFRATTHRPSAQFSTFPLSWYIMRSTMRQRFINNTWGSDGVTSSESSRKCCKAVSAFNAPHNAAKLCLFPSLPTMCVCLFVCLCARKKKENVKVESIV